MGILSKIDLTRFVTGILSALLGGTGRNSLTAKSLLVGNGTDPVNFIAPGTSGNVLTSDGTDWISQTPTPKYQKLISFTGALNGTNAVFTLSSPIIADTDIIFLTTVKMRGSGNDYTLNGAGDEITFDTNRIPQSSDWIEIYGVEQ